MNKLFIVLVSLMLTTTSISCKKESDVVDPAPESSSTTPSATEAITPVGTPEGTAITTTIGPAGGNIQSTDGRIQVNIPAGALASAQTISVQPLTNNCPAGTGQAFRLTPHGITFAKPATITFHYDDQDINGSAPEVLRIAYQTENGYWQSPAVKSLDTTAQTVSIQTTHFSDWGMFRKISLSPSSTLLAPGESVALTVSYTEDRPALTGTYADLFVPLPSPLPEKYIKNWTLQGEGTLAHQQNKGTYYAPERIPAVNPAAVSVSLNMSVTIDGQVFNDVRLVSNVYVAPEGISVQIDGSDWETYLGGASISDQRNIILGKNGTQTISLGWIGKLSGVYHWTKDVGVSFELNKGKLIYQHIYGKSVTVSGGSLRAETNAERWIFGTFTLQPAGWVETAHQKTSIGTAAITGVFRVKRVN